jgi:hypothetical protein
LRNIVAILAEQSLLLQGLEGKPQLRRAAIFTNRIRSEVGQNFRRGMSTIYSYRFPDYTNQSSTLDPKYFTRQPCY